MKKGSKHSKETLIKMRFRKLGKKYSEATKEKKSQALKKAYSEGRHRRCHEYKGIKRPKEICRKISQTKKGHSVSEETRRAISKKRLYQIFPKRDSSIEIKLQNILIENSIPYEKHKAIIGQPDIFIEPNICIFADGCYWHGCESCFDRNKFDNRIKMQKVRDLAITQQLQNEGYIVLRFWEHEINLKENDIFLKIKQFVRCHQ